MGQDMITVLCSVKGCTKDVHARDRCRGHYTEMYRRVGPSKTHRHPDVPWRECLCGRRLAEHSKEELVFGCRT